MRCRFKSDPVIAGRRRKTVDQRWARRDELVAFTPVAGVEVRVVSGERLMTCWITLAPETELPAHEHPEEQIGIVIEGTVDVTIAGEQRSVGPGEAYLVLGNVRHQARTGAAGCRLVESFSPPRPDYLARGRGEG